MTRRDRDKLWANGVVFGAQVGLVMGAVLAFLVFFLAGTCR